MDVSDLGYLPNIRNKQLDTMVEYIASDKIYIELREFILS